MVIHPWSFFNVPMLENSRVGGASRRKKGTVTKGNNEEEKWRSSSRREEARKVMGTDAWRQ